MKHDTKSFEKAISRIGAKPDWLNQPRFSWKNVIYAIVLLALVRYGFHHVSVNWH